VQEGKAYLCLPQKNMYKEYFIWLLGLVLVAAVAYGYAHQRNIHQRYNDFRGDQVKLEGVRHEVEALRGRLKETTEKVEKMKNNPLEIEAAVRKDTRMTREDEIIFHVEDNPAANAGQVSPMPDVTPTPGVNEE
jgi:cell division protein FtsB